MENPEKKFVCKGKKAQINCLETSKIQSKTQKKIVKIMVHPLVFFLYSSNSNPQFE